MSEKIADVIKETENNKADQPYGGLFEEYGFSAKE